MKIIKLGLIVIGLMLTTLQADGKEALTYKKFAHLPLISKVSVSPDGKHSAAVYQSEAGPSVVVSKFGSKDIATVAKLRMDRDRIDAISWSGSKRLIIHSSVSEKYSKNRWRESYYFAVNLDGSNLIEIKPKRLNRGAEWEIRLASRVRLISSLPKDDDHILVQAYDIGDRGQAVFKVNINDNSFEKQFSNRYDVHSWFVNSNGVPIFGIGSKKHEPEVIQYWYREPGTEEWLLINEMKNMSGDTFSPLVVQNGKLWVKSDRDLDRDAIWEFDPKTATFGKLVYAHPKFDVTGLIMNADKSKAIGVEYVDHFPETHYFEKGDTDINQLVANSFPGYKTVIASRSQRSDKLLVIAYKNDSPAKYFWLDIAGGKGGFWFGQYPYIERMTLGKTEPFTYKARDGMELYGYLTMPPNLKKGEQPPLIIHPHGGPFGPRDNQNFDYMVQFLANLGYAVLQPNFRGSGGYGSVYQTAGYKQWGLKMQDDVYDSVEWLKKQGTVDTSNACIVGWSYGGYVALTGAFQKPTAYQCIISIAGVSDVEMLTDEGQRQRSALTEFHKKAIGNTDIDAEKEQLANASAINFVERIKAPILLIHGKNDTQVHYGQSAAFYEEGKEAGLDIDYIEYETGTHYLDEYNNRLDAFMHIEKFLKKHLKAK